METKVAEISGYKTKYEDFISNVNEEKTAKWENIKKSIFVEKENPHYEKYSKVFPKFKTGDELTPEDIDYNLQMYDTYNEIGFFGVVEQNPEDKPPKEPPKGNYKSPFDVFE